MCGINGFIKQKFLDISEEKKALEKMNQEIIHRGPDEDGLYIEKIDKLTVAMAIRRLSIIDLSTGSQPIFSEDKQMVIVFNGEIYNYRELKREFLSNEHFSTHTDTEVVLKLYEKFGKGAFKLLDGMFAFSIFDKKIRKVFIARDFFGEKPLYYKPGNEDFYWCSELKSFKKLFLGSPKICINALNLYFQLTYIPAPYTIYEGFYKLEANHYLEIDIATLKFEINKIYDFKPEPIQKISFEHAKIEIRKMVEESVLSRSISDVPIGTFLSGGVDSSIVSLCLAKNMGKINTFSIGFQQKGFDESQKSRSVAKLINSNHFEFIISEKEIEKDISKVLLNFDEPFADSSALPCFIVSQKTGKQVKVALTGDGGDEIFSGYNKHLIGKINKNYTSLVPENLHSGIKKLVDFATSQKYDSRGFRFKVRKALNAIHYEDDFYYNILKLGFQEFEARNILTTNYFHPKALKYYKEKFSETKTLNNFREIDRVISLEGDLLAKVDRTSMLSSIECRAPYLNKKLWDYTGSLPENYLINGKSKKHILKKAFEKDFPKGFLDKPKQGFGVPVGNWLKTILKEELLTYTEPKLLEEQGIFSIANVKQLVNEHLGSVKDNTFRVWTFYCFQKWYFQNFKNNLF